MRFVKFIIRAWLIMLLAAILWSIFFPEPEYIPPTPREPEPIEFFWDKMRREAIRDGRIENVRVRRRVSRVTPDHEYILEDIMEGDDDE